MNKIIEQLIRNVQVYAIDRIEQVDNLTRENVLDEAFMQTVISALYDSDLHDNLKEDFSISDLKEEVMKLFKKVEPTQAVAESIELETWLDSARRINPEFRFNCYKQFLVKDNKGSIVEQLTADTYKILDSCHDPRELGRQWDRRGLVYGHVQSGKTANYIGLINRAFDAGYQIVIVLTGMTEDLRRQTQERVDSGVVGKSASIPIGIGREVDFMSLTEITPATSIKKDLKKSDDWRHLTLDYRKKSVWVIKKNKTVLENLISWLDKQRSIQESEKIVNVPFLVIDDEADNASIQSLTKKEFEQWETGMDLQELDFDELTEDQEIQLNSAKDAVIRAINRNIRVALSLMAHKTFVAYTATPYSVVNQTIEDLEREVIIDGKSYKIDEDTDLFPEHFIIPIRPGSKYMGIERLFTTSESKKLPSIINISKPPYSIDVNSYFPTKRGVDYNFSELPESLKDSITHFIISIIIRNHRGHEDYNSMLVHTSHLTSKADYLAVKIDRYVQRLKKNLMIDQENELERFQKIFSEIKQISLNPLFSEYFGNSEYPFPKRLTKNDIIGVLDSEDQPFEIVSYHSSNNPMLTHQNRTLKFNLRDEQTLKRKFKNYLVIGGNRLSRGLTLEGLTTSYFVRNSTRQDSLYQMGRWFGYRVNFEDLIRIFIPEDQIRWFEGVYHLEMDLRRDFEENNSEDTKKMPKDAIIKLAHHTDETMGLSKDLRKKFPTICDPAKLRFTKTMKMSFFGSTKTNYIINDDKIQKRNMKFVRATIEKIAADDNVRLFNNDDLPAEFQNNNFNFISVNYKYILELINNYSTADAIDSDITSLGTFIKENKDELNDWSVVLVNRGNKSEDLGWDLINHNGELTSISPVQRKNEGLDGGSTKKNLFFKQILEGRAKDISFDLIDASNREKFIGTDISNNDANRIRNEKKIPILVIYLVHNRNIKDQWVKAKTYPLLFFIIPIIKGGKKVNYIVRNQRSNQNV